MRPPRYSAQAALSQGERINESLYCISIQWRVYWHLIGSQESKMTIPWIFSQHNFFFVETKTKVTANINLYTKDHYNQNN